MSDRFSRPLDAFKERELEILELMAQGFSNREIADQLFVTRETIRWYNKQIYSKLGTSRRVEAINLAQEMSLIGDKGDPSVTHSVQHRLPITTGPFVGRDDETAELGELLAKPDIRLLSIVAMGGMGKSRLALELGHIIQANYEHGAAFIDLTLAQKPEEVIDVTVSSLGLSVNGRQKPQDVLFDYCREKELLLIFDNFEHLLVGGPLLADLLGIAPRVTAIVTTRERLNLQVESVWYLQPMTESGDKLFCEVAMMMYPNLRIEEEEQSDIQRIVTLVGGLPLALILAASWVDTLSIAEIGEEIQTSLDFLSANMGDAPDRQRSMRAVFVPTWKRLGAKEQKAFMWAAVFRGGFTRQSFQEVTGASIRTLQTLVNQSLISQGHGRRFDMHPLLREYAYLKLEEARQVNEAKQAHLRAFLAYAEAQMGRQSGLHYINALDALDMEQDNFRAALDWSLLGEATDDGVALIRVLSHFWTDRSHIREAVEYVDMAIRRQPERAFLYERSGYYHYRLGEYDTAEARIRKSIEVAQAPQQLDTLANSYRLMAIVQGENNSDHETRALIEKALALAQKIGSPRVIANCCSSMGTFLYQTDAPPATALRYFQKELAIWEELGDIAGIARVIYNMAVGYSRIGDTEQARELCERSLALKRQIGDRAGIARRLSVLALWDILDEEYERARGYLVEASAISEELGEQSRLVYALNVQGIFFLIIGEYEDSKSTLNKASLIAVRLKKNAVIQSCQSNLGLLYLMQGQIESALPHIHQAIDAVRETEQDPFSSMMAYANYLWYAGEVDACVPIAAVLSVYLEQSERGDVLSNRFFFHPLIYRVQQKIGSAAWQDALAAASKSTVEEVFQEMVRNHRIA